MNDSILERKANMSCFHIWYFSYTIFLYIEKLRMYMEAQYYMCAIWNDEIKRTNLPDS